MHRCNWCRQSSSGVRRDTLEPLSPCASSLEPKQGLATKIRGRRGGYPLLGLNRNLLGFRLRELERGEPCLRCRHRDYLGSVHADKYLREDQLGLPGVRSSVSSSLVLLRVELRAATAASSIIIPARARWWR